MSVEVKTGNIFTSQCQTLVNTVNCVGVMGAGIALECRLRYPAMFKKYEKLCEAHRFSPGLLWLYKGGSDESDINDKWVLNFPTKVHWKYPSKIEWVCAGLDKFVSIYREKQIVSIAFPVLGGLNGGLDPEEVISVMQSKLSVCDIPIEIYQYSSGASDDLYDEFKKKFLKMSPDDISNLIKMQKQYIRRVVVALENPDIHQLNQLAKVEGVGGRTLEKAFQLMRVHHKIQGELDI